MVIIIHGDDIVSSRKYLQDEKRRSNNPRFFDGEIYLQDLIQVVQGGALFDSEKRVFIENFFSKNKLNASNPKGIIDYIKKNESLFEVFFWEGKELQKKHLKLFNNPTIKIFMIPKIIFLFLESIKPSNYKNSISLFHKALQNTELELIFFMIHRQFRMLIALRSKVTHRGTPESSQIDEIMRLAPWQKGKLEKQGKLFSIEKLLDLYKMLYNIELKHKTGGLPYSLDKAIDFFLLKI